MNVYYVSLFTILVYALTNKNNHHFWLSSYLDHANMHLIIYKYKHKYLNSIWISPKNHNHSPTKYSVITQFLHNSQNPNAVSTTIKIIQITTKMIMIMIKLRYKMSTIIIYPIIWMLVHSSFSHFNTCMIIVNSGRFMTSLRNRSCRILDILNRRAILVINSRDMTKLFIFIIKLLFILIILFHKNSRNLLKWSY